MMKIHEIREAFPVTKRKTFLNHAGVSPLPKPISEAVQACLENLTLGEECSFELSEGRKLFAELVNGEPDEIALVPNTSTGLN